MLHRQRNQEGAAARRDHVASLSVRDLTVTYPNGTTALRDASFELGPGTICGLVGVNGSGKSTLFKAIMGFVKPQRGDVRVAGMAAPQALQRNLVAYVPQSEEVDWNFPVLVDDVVMMGRYGRMGFLRIPSALDRRKVDEALERVGMSDYRMRQIGELSGGQKKRVFLARALAQEGQVILLDEPFTGVDLNAREALLTLLERLRPKGITVLVSTHDMETAAQRFELTALLNRRLIAYGEPASVFTQEHLSEAFGGQALFLGGMVVIDQCCSGVDDGEEHRHSHGPHTEPR
jgi:manganese/iron transport system ATP-binding protein